MQINVGARERGGGLSYKWLAASVIIIGVFMSILDTTIVNIAIPRLQTAFGADIHSVQWVITAYTLTQGVVTPAAAYFSDTFGIKRVYIISLIGFTIGSALCGLAWSLPILILFRILQGIGGAMLFPLGITMLFREFPPNQRGTAMGFFGIPALLAPALGPTLGGYLVTFAGWQLIFYINVPLGILATIMATVLLRESPLQSNTRFDFLGFFFAAAGLGSVLYAFSAISTDGWGSAIVLGFLAGGLLLLALFVVTELILVRRGGQPLLDLRIFNNGLFRASTIASFFVIFSLFGGLFLFPVYLQGLRGLSAFQAGLILLPQALASMVTVILGGRLVDRVGVRLVMIPGLFLLGFATWQLSFITIYSSYGWIQGLLILRGLALGLVVQPLTVAGLSQIGPRQLAQASSINTVTRSVSSSLGVALLATLVQTQSQVHYGRLAEQLTSTPLLTSVLTRLQALFMAHGAPAQTAYGAALQTIARQLFREGYVLAIQDAFAFTVITVALAIITVFFVRKGRRPTHIPESRPTASTLATGEAEEAEPLALVFAE